MQEARGLDLEGGLVELALVFPLLPPLVTAGSGLAGVRRCRAPGFLGKTLAAKYQGFVPDLQGVSLVNWDKTVIGKWKNDIGQWKTYI